jgi:hypothetical protein
MPLVLGAIAVAFLSVLNLQPGVSNSLTDSGDAQVMSASFQNDVQSASSITTASTGLSPAPCASSSQYQILGLQLANQKMITYAVAPEGSSYNLYRNVCSGASETDSHVVARDLPGSVLQPSTPPVTLTCASTTSACQNVMPSNQPAYQTNWESTVGITGVTFATTEPGSKYSYNLTAVPAAAFSSQLAPVSSSSSNCGFALPGTGTYATQLCFVDFSAWNTQAKATGMSCQGSALPMSAQISNTPFILTFCVSVNATSSTGQAITGNTSQNGRVGWNDITASPLPTYASPPTSEAFLGNNGFYTGVPGNPAFYTVDQNSTATVSITNIKLETSSGVAATNWELVTGDAESTDKGESITWNSNQPLQLVPNSSSSDVGNSCDSTAPGYNTSYLTGVGTTTVECASPVSADHTGAVMLEANSPTSLTVTLQGTGLQAMFLGVLLP